MKVLFCGLGSIGQRHLRNLKAIAGDDIQISAFRGRGTSPVLNPDMTVCQGADIEKTYGIRSFTVLKDALEEAPDVVFVTNPNSMHVSVALQAAEAGCHLFIEKPVSHEAEGLAELLAIVERKKLVVLVAYQFRFHPGLDFLRSVIESGKLGRLASAHIVNGEYLPDWHPYEDYRESHAARRILGGGCLSIQTHEIDYALWLFGMPKRVFAVGGHLSDLEVDVEDSVDVLLDCESHGKLMPVHIHLDYLQRPPQRVCEVVGDGGKARYDYYAGNVEVHYTRSKSHEAFSFSEFDRNQMFVNELKHFLACIRGEATPVVDLREGMRSLMIGLAAKESLRTGAAVDVSNV